MAEFILNLPTDPGLWAPNGLNGRTRHYRPRGNDGDRAQWAKQGAVVGAALWFFQAVSAAQEKPAQRKRRADLRGQMGKSGRRPLEEAALRLEPHGATTATAASGRERKLLLAPRSNICKGVSPAANIG